jgi:hypothetical protein
VTVDAVDVPCLGLAFRPLDVPSSSRTSGASWGWCASAGVVSFVYKAIELALQNDKEEEKTYE